LPVLPSFLPRVLGRTPLPVPRVRACSQLDPELPPFSPPALRLSTLDLGSYCLFDLRAAQDRHWLVQQVLVALRFKWATGAAWFPKDSGKGSRKWCTIHPFLAVLVLYFSFEKYDIFTGILCGLSLFEEWLHCGPKLPRFCIAPLSNLAQERNMLTCS
jgi:hypothetical protein